MAEEVGSAYARFFLDFDDLKQGVNDVRTLMQEARQLVSDPIVATFRINVDIEQFRTDFDIAMREMQTAQTVLARQSEQLPSPARRPRRQAPEVPTAVPAPAAQEAGTGVSGPDFAVLRDAAETRVTAAEAERAAAERQLAVARRSSERVQREEQFLTTQEAELEQLNRTILNYYDFQREAYAQRNAATQRGARRVEDSPEHPEIVEPPELTSAQEQVLTAAVNTIPSLRQLGAEYTQARLEVEARQADVAKYTTSLKRANTSGRGIDAAQGRLDAAQAALTESQVQLWQATEAYRASSDAAFQTMREDARELARRGETLTPERITDFSASRTQFVEADANYQRARTALEEAAVELEHRRDELRAATRNAEQTGPRESEAPATQSAWNDVREQEQRVIIAENEHARALQNFRDQLEVTTLQWRNAQQRLHATPELSRATQNVEEAAANVEGWSNTVQAYSQQLAGMKQPQGHADREAVQEELDSATTRLTRAQAELAVAQRGQAALYEVEGRAYAERQGQQPTSALSDETRIWAEAERQRQALLAEVQALTASEAEARAELGRAQAAGSAGQEEAAVLNNLMAQREQALSAYDTHVAAQVQAIERAATAARDDAAYFTDERLQDLGSEIQALRTRQQTLQQNVAASRAEVERARGEVGDLATLEAGWEQAKANYQLAIQEYEQLAARAQAQAQAQGAAGGPSGSSNAGGAVLPPVVVETGPAVSGIDGLDAVAQAAKEAIPVLEATAGAARNLSAASDEQLQRWARAASAARQYANSVAFLSEQLRRASAGGDAAAAEAITLRLAHAETQLGAQLNQRAVLQARAAASDAAATGDLTRYEQALTVLRARIAEVGADTDAGLRLRQTETAVMREQTRAIHAQGDALTEEARRRGDVGGMFRQLAVNQRQAETAAPGGGPDVARQRALQQEELQLRVQMEAALEAEQRARYRAAVDAGRYGEAVSILDGQLKSTNLTVADEVALLSQREQIMHRQVVADNDAAISSARLSARYAEFDEAQATLAGRFAASAGSTEETLRLINEYSTVLDRAAKRSDNLADAETRRALIQRDLPAALASNQAALDQISNAGDPRDAERVAELMNERAEILRRMSDEQVRNERSAVGLARQQGLLGEAIATVDVAMARTAQGETAFNTLMRTRIQLEQQQEKVTRQIVDAQIAAARAARDRAEAERLVNAEIARQRVLPAHLGGGGGGVPPGSPPGTAALPPAGDETPRIQRLLATQQQIANIPTFWSRAGDAALRYVGPLAAVTLGYQVLTSAQQAFSNALETIARNDLAQRQLGALFNNVERGRNTFQAAIEFGRRFNITQREIGEAAGEAGIILQNTAVSAGRAFEIIARLQTRAPQQNFQAAVRSIAELQSGQLQSIERTFNVPRQFAQQMSREISAGLDPLVALDRTLNQLGQTSSVLDERTKGPLADFQALSVGGERLGIALANLAEQGFAGASRGLANFSNGLAALIEHFNTPINLEQLRQGAELIAKQRSATGGLSDLPILRELSEISDAFGAAGAAADIAAKDQERSLMTVQLGVDEVRDHALAAAPALAQFLAPGASANGVTNEIIGLNERLNVLVSRFQSGQISAQRFYEGIKAARATTQDTDTGTDVAEAGLRRIAQEYNTVEDRISATTALANALQAAMGKDPALRNKLGADVEAVAAELVHLESLSPVDIEIRIQQVGNLEQFVSSIQQAAKREGDSLRQLSETHRKAVNDAVREAGTDAIFGPTQGTQRGFEFGTINTERDREIARANRDLQRQQAREQNELERQQALANNNFRNEQDRALFDHARERARGITEFNRQQARQQQEFDRSQARERTEQQHQFDLEDEDRQVAQARKRRDRQQEDTRAEQEYRRDLMQMQRDFNRQSVQDEEDYNDERNGLLAQGRIAEAAVLQFRFNRAQRRRADQLSTQVSDRSDQFAQTTQDTANQRRQQDADEEADLARSRQRQRDELARRQTQAQADFNEAAALRQADFDRQLQQADQAFNEQYALREAQFQRQQQQERDNQAHQQELARQDLDLRLADIRENADRQIAAIVARLEEERAEYAQKRGEINEEYRKTYDEQQAILDAHNKEVQRIEELKQQGVGEKEAQAIAKLETARDEYKRVLGEIGASFGDFDLTQDLDRINSQIDEFLRRAKGGRTPIPGGGGGDTSTFGGDNVPPVAAPSGAEQRRLQLAQAELAGVQQRLARRNIAPETATDLRRREQELLREVAALEQAATRTVQQEATTRTRARQRETASSTDYAVEETRNRRTSLETQDRDTTAYHGSMTQTQVREQQTRLEAQTTHQATVERSSEQHHTAESSALSTWFDTTLGMFEGWWSDWMVTDSQQHDAYMSQRGNEEVIEEAQQSAHLHALANGLAQWVVDTMTTVGQTIQQIVSDTASAINLMPTPARAAGSAGGGAQGVAAVGNARAGIIGNFNPTDDPRPSTGAVQSLFGPSAHITSTYDSARPGTTGVHRGLDVSMDIGSRVPSPLAMVITRVSKDDFGEWTTVMGIDQFGRQWLFAHLTRVPLRVGQRINKGDTLGFIGAAAHVHVQLRRQDDSSVPVDPSGALEGAAGNGGSGLAGPPAPIGAGGAQTIHAQSVGSTGRGVAALGDRNTLMLLQAAQDRTTAPRHVVHQPLNIRLSGNVTMDGAAMGTFVAEKAIEVVMDDFSATATEAHTANDIIVRQRGFRGLP